MEPSLHLDEFFEGTTFGMEFDCGEFDRNLPTPEGVIWCDDEVAAHTNKGIGADPKLVYNCWGGEAKLGPFASEADLLGCANNLVASHIGERQLTYPSTIHVHVRIPKLLERIDLLNDFLHWSTYMWPICAEILFRWKDTGKDDYTIWHNVSNRTDRVSVYGADALERAEEATNPWELAHALHDYPTVWKNEWISSKELVKRPAINFSHLRDLETIEFRCFMASTNPEILHNIVHFPMWFFEMWYKKDGRLLRHIAKCKWQDKHETPALELAGKTSGYFVDQKLPIAKALISRQITIADLNYPQYWIDKGFD